MNSSIYSKQCQYFLYFSSYFLHFAILQRKKKFSEQQKKEHLEREVWANHLFLALIVMNSLGLVYLSLSIQE